LAEQAVEAFPKLVRLTSGEWAGRPFALEGWQADDIVRPTFGWRREDGTRRYRRVIVFVPKKNGKTEMAAGLGLVVTYADGELGGQGYCLATNRDQARIVFEKMSAMVAMSPALAKHFTPLKTAIWCAQLNNAIKPLTGKPQGKHGLEPSLIIGDEVHEWPDSELYDFVRTGAASRRQPLEFLISTAGVRQGFGWELWQHCQRVLAGEVDDPETLIVIYAAGQDDDWTDPAVWAKANPNFGVSVKEAYLAAEVAKARDNPRLENTFRRYHLNQWTEQLVRWIQMEKWGSVGTRWAAPEFESELEGQPCFIGLDLSSTTDLSAACLWFPPHGERQQWRKLTRVWMPADNVAVAVRRDHVGYDQWIASGAMRTTPGNTVDYGFIREAVLDDCSRFDVQAIGLDPFNAHQFAQQLQNDDGLPVVYVRQGFLSLNAPTKEFERLVLSGLVDHGGHPVARWCVGNAAVATDAAGSIKPAKDKSTGRIDTVAADIDALAVWLASRGPISNPWDDPDFSLSGNG
jgi:phage terminase large subunit-like protein